MCHNVCGVHGVIRKSEWKAQTTKFEVVTKEGCALAQGLRKLFL